MNAGIAECGQPLVNATRLSRRHPAPRGHLPLILVQPGDPVVQQYGSTALCDRLDLARELRGEDRFHLFPAKLLDRLGCPRETRTRCFLSLRRTPEALAEK